LETRKPSTRAKWRSSRSACRSVAQNALDSADIVRDGDFSVRMVFEQGQNSYSSRAELVVAGLRCKPALWDRVHDVTLYCDTCFRIRRAARHGKNRNSSHIGSRRGRGKCVHVTPTSWGATWKCEADALNKRAGGRNLNTYEQPYARNNRSKFKKVKAENLFFRR